MPSQGVCSHVHVDTHKRTCTYYLHTHIYIYTIIHALVYSHIRIHAHVIHIHAWRSPIHIDGQAIFSQTLVSSPCALPVAAPPASVDNALMVLAKAREGGGCRRSRRPSWGRYPVFLQVMTCIYDLAAVVALVRFSPAREGRGVVARQDPDNPDARTRL